MTGALARALVRASAWLVPADRRPEWREEWLAELHALESGGGPPGLLSFALGALPHAVWARTEGWTTAGAIHDLRYAGRRLRRAPGFTAAATLTLALGIGANATIFSLVNGLLFRAPAGIAEPERLVQIARSYESDPRWDNWSWPAMQLIAAEADALDGVAGRFQTSVVIGSGPDVETLAGEYVTAEYFEVLGARPLLGRLLQPSDAVALGGHPVVVLGHALWSRRFGSDSGVVGRTVRIRGEPYEIVGVAEPGFTGVETVATPSELWVPVVQAPSLAEWRDQWGTSWIDVVGRLAPDVPFEAAEASMDAIATRLRAADPVNEDIRVLLASGVGLDPEGRRQAKQVSLLLLTIVGIVLLLTCTNVANLFLARASARRREVGVRMALGAGRGRLARQLLTESGVLGALAVVSALPLVLAAGHLVPLAFPYTLAVSVGPDVRVLAFLAAVGVGAGLLLGVLPAWAAARRDLVSSLREGASSGGRSGARLRDALVVVQLALSLALVTGAALLGRSVANARSARPGFEPAGLVGAAVDLESTGRYDQAAGMDLYERLLAEAERTPGVESATLANQMPIAGGHSRATVRPLGREDVAFEAEHVVVGPRYFETLGIPIRGGRGLGSSALEAEGAVVVNEALARLFWPGEEAVGQRLQGEPPLRVVGVAGDVQMRSLREAGRPAVYHVLGDRYDAAMVLHVRGRDGRPPAAAAIRGAIAAVDPALPVATVVDLHATLAESMGETRTIGHLVGAFAFLALVLAAVGLYGVVSYGVSQRVREMGIRTALGAAPGSLVRLVLSRGVVIALLGALTGLALSLLLARALRGLLFGVSPGNVPTLAAATAVLLLTALVSAWLPARRASRVDAARSLRD